MKNSIARKLTVFILLLAVVPILAAGTVITLRTFNREKTTTFDLHKIHAISISHQVDDFMKNAQRRLRDLSIILSYHSGNIESQQKYMDIMGTSDYNTMTLADKSGWELARTSRYKVVINGPLNSIRDEQSFIIPKGTLQTYFGPIRFHPITREPLMTISMPLTSPLDGKFNGVLKTEIRLKKIWNIFISCPHNEEHLAYLLDERSRIIAHPNSSVVLRGTRTLYTGSQGIQDNYKGERSLFVRQPVTIGNKEFSVIVEAPAKTALANAYNSMRVLIITLLCALGISASLHWHSRMSIIKPLQQLMHAVIRLKNGNMAERVKARTNDEVGSLMNAFNEMATQLEQELAERMKAEAALRQSEERFRVLFNSGNDAIFVHGFTEAGMPTKFIEVNEIACKKLGYSRDELRHLAPQDIDVPEMLERLPFTMEALHTDKHVLFEMVHQTKKGDHIPVEISAHEFLLDNRPHMMSIARDITERKQAENKIIASLKEKEVLLQEIHHRVKNNMAIISGLLQLQILQLSDDDVINIFRESQNKIRAMALVHEKLYQSKDFANINFKEYTQALMSHLIQTYNSISGQINLDYNISDISFKIDTMIPCGLIMNELITNSIKHAFMDIKDPRISITFSSNEKDYTLTYVDNGIGLPDGIELTRSRTLGLQLISLLSDQLDGTVTLQRNHGFNFELRFPRMDIH